MNVHTRMNKNLTYIHTLNFLFTYSSSFFPYCVSETQKVIYLSLILPSDQSHCITLHLLGGIPLFYLQEFLHEIFKRGIFVKKYLI